MRSLRKQAESIIKENIYINIATASSDSHPWNTPVYAVHDDNLVFYWRSIYDAQHSKNIRENDNVFITIYDSSRKLGSNHRKCVYIKAKAMEVSDVDEISEILTKFENNKLTPNDFINRSVKRIYKAVPHKMWMNDKSESEITKETMKMRVEVELD